MKKYWFAALSCSLLAGCGTAPISPSPAHIKQEAAPPGGIPQTIKQSTVLPPPQPAPKVETYSVVVDNVPVRELLFALARDARINVDIHPRIEGTVTLNALNQTLPQLLNRIAKQVDMRYEIEGQVLTVMPDSPYLKQYKIDYLNMSRKSKSNVSIATQIESSGTSNSATGGAGNASNNSTTSVDNESNNTFWETLVTNVRDILRETDKLLPDGSSITTTEQTGTQSTTGTGAPASASSTRSSTAAPANLASSPNPARISTDNATTTQRSNFREAASVIANPENGVIAVRATSRQHEKIQEFIDQIMSSAKRQVLIEATIIEVQLFDQYQQGINWTSLRSFATTSQGSTTSSAISTQANDFHNVNPAILTLNYANPASRLGNMAATIQLLESFGKVKVLSSPKISVLNNQTALLKVVDNRVYFTIKATAPTYTNGVLTTPSTYTSELHTVPIGFVMSVTPQISSSEEITLNVRPTITRIIGNVQDPSPTLIDAKGNQLPSLIPIIQAREMESILKVASGQVAVMGGLMEDRIDNKKNGLPILSQLPGVGDIFSNREEYSKKTELVIFMRPVVIREASLNSDYSAFREFMPEGDFFTKPGPGDLKPFPKIAPSATP